MNWYLAKIIFQIVCGEGTHTAQFDEQLRLIAADNREMALHKAIELGKTEEDSFYNIHQQPVRWNFINVSELNRMEELQDGAEIYSKIKETEDADSYLTHIENRASLIKAKLQQELIIFA